MARNTIAVLTTKGYPHCARLMLRKDEVHVWCVQLDQTPSRVKTLFKVIAIDERCKADRFHFSEHKTRFIVARAMLRIILGRYLNMKPERLRFCYNRYGKPALTRKFGADLLRFNISHSDGLAVYAVTRGRDIGIDLEQVRAGFASDQIAEQFFSPREVVMLRKLPTDLQTEAFFNCWTRKEAYIKAKGVGLSFSLDQFVVSLAPGEAARLLETPDPDDTSRWSLEAMVPEPGFVAAVAAEGADWHLKCQHWPMRTQFLPAFRNLGIA